MRVLRRRWKWLAIPVALFALGVQPAVDFRESTAGTPGEARPAPCSTDPYQPGYAPYCQAIDPFKVYASPTFGTPAQKRVSVYLVNIGWRLFDVDFAGGPVEGLGFGVRRPLR
jgi:hypothetical protein